MREGDARSSHTETSLCPDDARALLRAWLAAVELDLEESELIAFLQRPDFFHADLYRRAKRVHERKLARAVNAVATATPGSADLPATATALFDACLAAIPYAPAAAFLGREKSKLARREGEPLRVALVADAVGGMHGVTHTLDELRERGVPGFEVEVVGTDHNVDRRLSAVAEIDIPFYAGLKVGVPSLPAIVEALADGRYDLVHLCSPGPSGAAAALIARAMGVPILGSYHTELAAYAGLRTQDPQLELAARIAIGAFYGQCRRVLSPSAASDAVLRQMGIADERIGRWDRGVDIARFSPARRQSDLLPGEITVLYAGRLTHEKGADLLADAFLQARARDPRLHLALAGGGPEEERLRARLGEHATFLGWLEGDALADGLRERRPLPLRQPHGHVRPGPARGAGQRPAGRRRRRGRPDEHRHRRDHRPAVPRRRARAGRRGRRARRRARAARAARRATRCAPSRERTWERSLQRLADGYRRALDPAAATRRAAPCRVRPRCWRRGGAYVPATGAARAAPGRAPAPLRVADVALFYGERSGGIRTYLDAKAAWAQASGLIEHHVVVPGRVERHEARPPRAAVAAPGGDERLPPAARRRRAEGHAARAAPRRRRAARPVLAPARRHADRARARREGRRRAPRLDRARRGRPAGPGSRSGIRCCARGCAAPTATPTRSCPPSTRARTAAAPRRSRCASASIRRSRPSATCAARTTCCASGASVARRASSSCCTPPRARSEPWQLKLVGRGPIEQRVRRLAQRLGHRRPRADVPVHRRPRAPRALVRQRARRRHARRARDLRPRRLRGGGDRRARRGLLDGAVGRAHRRARAHVRARRHRRAARRDRGRAGRPAGRRGRRRARPALLVGRRLRRRDARAFARLARPRPRACRWSRPDRRSRRRRAAARRRGGPARELARGDARRRPPLRVHVPGAAALPPHVALGLVLSRDRLVRGSTRRARAPSCAPCCAPGGRTASCRTRCSGTRRRGWRRAPLYATRGLVGDRCTESVGPPLLAFAWEIVAAASRADDPGLSRRGAWPRSPATWTGSSTHRDPDGDGLLSIILPDESGLDDSPKYAPVFGRCTHDRPGYWLLVERARRAGWDSRAHHRRRRPPRRGRLVQRRLRAVAARDGAPERRRRLVARGRARVEAALLERCWDERRGLFFDLAGRAERPVRVSTWTALAPLVLRDLPEPVRRRLVEEHLLDARRYAAPCGIPSVSMEEPTFNPRWDRFRCWRGPSWMNTAWLLVPALRELGYDDARRADRRVAGAGGRARRPSRVLRPADRARASARAGSAGRRCSSTSDRWRLQRLEEGEQLAPLARRGACGSASRAGCASPPCQRIASARLRARPSCRKRVWRLTTETRPMPHSGAVRHSGPWPGRRGGRRRAPGPCRARAGRCRAG